MAKNWDYAARVVWPLLTKRARNGQTITYGEIAPKINTGPRNVGRALGPIQDFCLESRLPPLTAIVVGKISQEPGHGFIAWDVDDLESGQQAVFKFEWEKIPNPYGRFGRTDSEESLAEELVDDPDVGDEVYAKVRVRGVAQRVFKLALLKAYNYQCAFCGLTFDEALHGCHILSWEKSSHAQRLDPRNGILLCSSHHCLFDHGLITLSDSGRIIYRDAKMKCGPYSESDKALSVLLNGKKARLPEEKRLWPSARLLGERHRLERWDRFLP